MYFLIIVLYIVLLIIINNQGLRKIKIAVESDVKNWAYRLFTEENIREFRGFWNDRECFLATIFYLVIIVTKNMHC